MEGRGWYKVIGTKRGSCGKKFGEGAFVYPEVFRAAGKGVLPLVCTKA